MLPRDRVVAELDKELLPPCARAEPEPTQTLVEAPKPAETPKPTATPEPAEAPKPALPVLLLADILAEIDNPKPVATLPPCPPPVVAASEPLIVRKPVKPTSVVVAHGEIKLNEKILFDIGQATIRPKSDSLLRSLADAIKDHPDIQYVEIAGHADKRGGDYLNLGLTKLRAESVVSRLITLGVDAKRLRGVGYGAYCPISDQETELAFEKNRRVEFKILRRGGKDLTPKWGGCERASGKGMRPKPIPASAPKDQGATHEHDK